MELNLMKSTFYRKIENYESKINKLPESFVTKLLYFSENGKD
jgi:hypothetical protein